MSRPKYWWYEVAKKILRNYPELYKRHREAQEQKITANYSDAPGGGGASRKTEKVALCGLSQQEEENLDAVRNAINIAGRWREGVQALYIVELVDWERTHSIEGAAQKLHISKRSAERLHSRVIYEVARQMKYF